MTAPECPREHSTVRAVLARRMDDEIRAHAEACGVCRELMLIATAFSAERDDALREVHVPAAGQVWWRSALRAHAEATRTARRPILWLQGIAGASAAGVGAALVGVAWPSIREAAVLVARYGATLRPEVAPWMDSVRSVAPVAVAALACLVLAPLAVYYVLSDE